MNLKEIVFKTKITSIIFVDSLLLFAFQSFKSQNLSCSLNID